MASSIAIVIGPTPPGTGVISDATSLTSSNFTSPTMRYPRGRDASVTRLMPTSITTAPGFTMSAVTISGLPMAAIRMSARRVCAARSLVREWQTVTVQSAPFPGCINRAAIGLPTIVLRPRITASKPAVFTPLSISMTCTPAGVQVMLMESGVNTAGLEAVILGRSTIVGKPMAALLMQPGKGADCTVTVCHSRTKDLAAHTRRADILIAAIGKPEMVTADMVKPGAVVIDVGINRVTDASLPRGYRIVGDVKFDEVSEVASLITPVPGGVGPMTIAMLLANTVRAARKDLQSATGA